MRFAFTFAVSSLIAGPTMAAQLAITVEIPRLKVAEYHKPYVAIWLEDKTDKSVTNLNVWYDHKLKNGEGTKWLKDMRQWWRSTGRDLQMPVDGITGATRAPGEHTISFSTENGPMADLPHGKYELLVEAAREVGGRELLRIPLDFAPDKPVTATADGKEELGIVKVSLTP